jgi:hypothetical protein
VPTARAAVEYVATPLEFTVPVPSGVDPSLKVTVPVGEPAEELTVAVKMIEFCTSTGFEFDVNVMLGVACVALLTVSVTLPVALLKRVVLVGVKLTFSV